LQTAEKSIEGIAAQVAEADHADASEDLVCFFRTVGHHEFLYHRRVRMAAAFGIVLSEEERRDLVRRDVTYLSSQ